MKNPPESPPPSSALPSVPGAGVSTDKAGRFVDRALRGLPDHPAPTTLAPRVLAEIGRRRALPWWHKSYAHWPAAARLAFGPAALAALVFLAVGWLSFSQQVGALPVVGWMRGCADALAGLREVTDLLAAKAGVVVRALPPLWTYGTVAALVLCYGTLVTLGAAAYRAIQGPGRASPLSP